MELSIKTTILFSPVQYAALKKTAAARKKSVGELIRSACEKEYGLVPRTEAVDAVSELSSLYLPAGSPAEMKREILQSKPEKT